MVDHWAELLVEGRFEEAREVVTINHEVIEREFNMHVSGREFLGPKASGRNLRLAVHRAARDQPCGRAISRTESTPELSFNYEASVFYELPLLGEWSSGTPAGDWNARISFLILVEPVADGLALELLRVQLRALRAADLEPLIRAQFPPKQGWLARQEDSDPTISELELLDDGGYFSNHILLRINVLGRFLETKVLPHGGSLGLFAYDHTNLRYLSGNELGFCTLVRQERRPLAGVDPYQFANVCAEALLVKGNDTHRVLRTADDLLPPPFQYYKVWQREFDRLAKLIRGPRIEGDGRSGWLLTFWTIHGWMDQKKTVTRQEIRISPEFALHHRQRLVSRWLFLTLSRVVY